MENISIVDSRKDDPKDFIEILKTLKIKSNILFKIRIFRCSQGEAKSQWVQQKVPNKQEVE